MPFILDGKREDIPETMKYYARACYDAWGADAVTLHAYMGLDTLAPFLERAEKGVYLLAVTSQSRRRRRGPPAQRRGRFGMSPPCTPRRSGADIDSSSG
ncbi:MAG: orotidine 5'-phosphate decarboxylase / HUMPS family protein [Kiritimatiellia bacterium]